MVQGEVWDLVWGRGWVWYRVRGRIWGQGRDRVCAGLWKRLGLWPLTGAGSGAGSRNRSGT